MEIQGDADFMWSVYGVGSGRSVGKMLGYGPEGSYKDGKVYHDIIAGRFW